MLGVMVMIRVTVRIRFRVRVRKPSESQHSSHLSCMGMMFSGGHLNVRVEVKVRDDLGCIPSGYC